MSPSDSRKLSRTCRRIFGTCLRRLMSAINWSRILLREAELGIWGTNSRHRLETGKEIGYQVTSGSWFMDLSYLKYGNISRGGVMIIFDLSCSVYSAHATSLVCLRILQQLLDSAGQACTCLFTKALKLPWQQTMNYVAETSISPTYLLPQRYTHRWHWRKCWKRFRNMEKIY